jgi:hypothetical protein
MTDLAVVNLLDDDSGRLVVRAVQAADPAKALVLQGLLGKSYVRREGVGGSASVLNAGLLQIIPPLLGRSLVRDRRRGISRDGTPARYEVRDSGAAHVARPSAGISVVDLVADDTVP